MTTSVAGITAATFTADAFNPIYYYLENRNNVANWYYDYFYPITFFNDLRWPIPKFWYVYKYGHKLEFWSAIFGWPGWELAYMLCIALALPTLLLSVYFYFRWENINGFAGYEWNFYPEYQDSSLVAVSF